MKMLNRVFSLMIVVSVVFAACRPIQRPAPTADTTAADASWKAPARALISTKVTEAPTLDGVADDAAWKDAPSMIVEVSHGANMGKTVAELRSVYTDEMVYFVIIYADPTESQQRSPWQLGADGKWTKLTDPNDKGGDNNLYYEDKFSLLWPIDNSVPKFERTGCFTACHNNDDTGKPYGNKYFETEGAMADLWHWKSVRNLNQLDDQYVDSTVYDKEKAPEAGRHSDPKESGGYVDNVNDDKTGPKFGMPDNKPAPPYSILESEQVPIDITQYKPGDEVPGIIKSQIVGDRGDIAAGWQYANGKWTIEFGRKLTTGSQYDVQFSDLTFVYHFGLAIFDNAQVRHAYSEHPTPFVFKP